MPVGPIRGGYHRARVPPSLFELRRTGRATRWLLRPAKPFHIALRPIQITMDRMTLSATSVRFDEHTMWVELTDGRTPGVPLAWFPRLLRATSAEREQVELSRVGLHWEAIDEDISIAGLLAGRGDVTRSPEHAAQ